MSVEGIKGRVLVDTNVLIYATLGADSRHEKAKKVLELRRQNDVEVFISAQNLSEMYPNLTGSKNEPPDTPELARKKIRAISRLDNVVILPVTIEIVNRALELCEEHGVRRQDYYDMQLVATMVNEGIETIITENKADFERLEAIRVVDPFVS